MVNKINGNFENKILLDNILKNKIEQGNLRNETVNYKVENDKKQEDVLKEIKNIENLKNIDSSFSYDLDLEKLKEVKFRLENLQKENKLNGSFLYEIIKDNIDTKF